ncbi:MAG: ABC transporter ATP-binding protein [Natronincolaceae bacterium]
MLQVRNLGLSFSKQSKVFDNVNFHIKKNTVTLISGNSGIGKSSLLMCITRVIPTTIDGIITGDIIYKDVNITDMGIEAISGDVGYMFQDPDSQLCTFTVEDEIAFGLENIKIDPKKMDELIDKALDITGIKNLRKRNLNQLSGGEKQKVALSSVLALDPEFIIMDEPTANLDPGSTQEIIKLIKKLKQDLGKTILIVEHKVNEIKDIIDQVVVINEQGAYLPKKTDFVEKHFLDLKLPYRNRIKNDTNGEPVIRLNGVSFAYNRGRKILKDINFFLGKGEILAIVGPNGAGKSTLAKLLMGLIKPCEGSIYINGMDLANMPPKIIGENVGLIFQNPEHQFIKMTVEKELALSLEIAGDSDEEIHSKVEYYLSLFELSSQKEMNPFSLSQGQKRRLSTASMMINGQPILILDEPTYGQDRENLQKLLKLLYEINKEGISILIITHDMDLVYSACDRYVHLENGEVLSLDKVDSNFRKLFEKETMEYEAK